MTEKEIGDDGFILMVFGHDTILDQRKDELREIKVTMMKGDVRKASEMFGKYLGDVSDEIRVLVECQRQYERKKFEEDMGEI